MKIILIIFSIVSMAAMGVGCSANGDVKFSPDPSIVPAVTQGEVAPAEEPAVVDEPVEVPADNDEEKEEVPAPEKNEVDCFVSGFCHRDCKQVSDCPAGFSCIMNVCTFDCQTNSECGKGGECNSVGLCEAVQGEDMALCGKDEECGEGRFCNAAGGCEKLPEVLGCQKDADCPSGQYCNELHECTLFVGAKSVCSADPDCPSSFYCADDKQCKQDCRVDIQCGAGEACAMDGKCMPAGEPAKIVSFNFNAAGADTDPSGPIAFSSENFRIDSAAITIAGRNATLVSPRFKLTGSIEY